MATRFHAYRFNGKEFAMSYAYGNAFLLVGGHYNDLFKEQLQREMKIMNVSTISCLFIPQWTEAFCGDGSLLGQLLKDLCPTHIIIPKWDSQQQFVARCKSHILKYQKEKTYADVQFLDDENKDHPSVSNNNLTILCENQEENGHIVAHRFESQGIWMTFDLCTHQYKEDVLKSDIVVCTTFKKEEMRRMLDASKCLKANVNIVYPELDMGWSILERLLSSRLCYSVMNSDVIVMREDSARAVVYNMDCKQHDLMNKKEYIPY